MATLSAASRTPRRRLSFFHKQIRNSWNLGQCPDVSIDTNHFQKGGFHSLRRIFQLLTVTGVMAGFTLSAIVTAQAATTDAVKKAKAELLKDAPKAQKLERTDKNTLRKSAVKAWKYKAPRQRVTSSKRYLGGDRAWYGDRNYFGSKLQSRGYDANRYRTSKYSGRYYCPTTSRSYDSFRPYKPGVYGRRVGVAPSYGQMACSGQHRCCCVR